MAYQPFTHNSKHIIKKVKKDIAFPEKAQHYIPNIPHTSYACDPHSQLQKHVNFHPSQKFQRLDWKQKNSYDYNYK
jgi:hypothetical protein